MGRVNGEGQLLRRSAPQFECAGRGAGALAGMRVRWRGCGCAGGGAGALAGVRVCWLGFGCAGGGSGELAGARWRKKEKSSSCKLLDNYTCFNESIISL